MEEGACPVPSQSQCGLAQSDQVEGNTSVQPTPGLTCMHTRTNTHTHTNAQTVVRLFNCVDRMCTYICIQLYVVYMCVLWKNKTFNEVEDEGGVRVRVRA